MTIKRSVIVKLQLPLRCAEPTPANMELEQDDIAWATRSGMWQSRVGTASARRTRRAKAQPALILAGHGVLLRIENGALEIKNGFTHYPPQREILRYFRGDIALPERIILDGSGSISFDVLSWLAEQKVPLIRIAWKGGRVCVAGASGYSANPFRVRGQLETRENPELRNEFCRSIITRKIEATITTLEKSISRSDKWERAMRSAYAALENEILIKAVFDGYGPTIGIIHEGGDGSSKLVFDLTEPQRPKVDRAVLDFVKRTVFDPADFTIRDDGVVRLNPQLARHMANLTTRALSFNSFQAETIMFALAPTDIDWFLNIRSAPGGPKANFWTPTPWSIKGLKPGDRLYFLLKSPIRKIGGWGAFGRYNDMTTEQTWTDDVGWSTQWTRRLQRLSLSIVAKKTNGREDTPTLATLARRFLCGWRRSKHEAAVLVALALLGAQASASAATRDARPLVSPLSWHLAQAASDSQPNTAAPTPRDGDKNKAEKAGVPATVVDGEQLESVLGVEALSSTDDDMGRIVDIIVDRSGQIRAAIIDFGGFLGVGSRKIAVDWRSLHFDPKKAGSVVVNLTKDQLRVAPVYKAAEPVVMIGGPDVKP